MDSFRVRLARQNAALAAQPVPYLVARVVRSFALGLVLGVALLFVGALVLVVLASLG